MKLPGHTEPAETLPPRGIFLREARPSEGAELSTIAYRAKASLGYPRTWLDAWREDLTITPAFIEMNTVYVAEALSNATVKSGRAAVYGQKTREVMGVVALEDGADGPEIAHLWVLPEAHGRGIGRALVERAIQEARSRGWHTLRILSDPYATEFYERMGAVRVGTHPAPVAGKPRELPVLRLSIEQF